MKTKKKISILVLFAFLNCLNYGAFAQGMKIVSPHPDLKFKITRCEAAGKNVIIDFLVENLSPNDVTFCMVNGEVTDIRDDEGNIYKRNNLDLFLGNIQEDIFGNVKQTLPSELPLKGRIKVVGVPESAKIFKRLQFMISSPELNVNPYHRWQTGEDLMIYNIPIYREGDE